MEDKYTGNINGIIGMYKKWNLRMYKKMYKKIPKVHFFCYTFYGGITI